MSAEGQTQLVAFRVGGERFAIPVADVDEVLDAPSIQRIPNPAPSVLGVTALRGAFVLMYDPRTLLRVAELVTEVGGGRIDGAALLFMRGDRRIGLAVDDVYDAMTVTDRDLMAPPATGGFKSFLTGIVWRGGELTAVVDTRALLDAATASHASSGEKNDP